MNGERSANHWRLVLIHLRWFIALRWIAGASVVIGAPLIPYWLRSFDRIVGTFAVGGSILVFNALLWHVCRRRSQLLQRPRTLMAIVWAQIIFDLGCLTILTEWTGGLYSPLVGLYVLHMVFASLLLRRKMAYGVATVATVMLFVSLWNAGQWPDDRAANVLAAGWVATLLLTVFVANHITRNLRGNEFRLNQQNRRILAMTKRLREQQEAMVQHEKMVALGQMSAGVAHEVANPLASMDSVLQLMERRPDRPRAEAISTLREQIQRIRGILDQMKSFAHPDMTLSESLPVIQIVDNAFRMIEFDHRLRAVEVERDLESTADNCCRMPGAMQQVLLNLLLNALDAMEDAVRPHLLVRTRRENGWCLLAVTDNGHGIDPDHQDQIFEPFFTTKPVGKGTGLGLSISYRFVQQHGGMIEIDSEPGAGSTFTIRFPCETCD